MADNKNFKATNPCQLPLQRVACSCTECTGHLDSPREHVCYIEFGILTAYPAPFQVLHGLIPAPSVLHVCS